MIKKLIVLLIFTSLILVGCSIGLEEEKEKIIIGPNMETGKGIDSSDKVVKEVIELLDYIYKGGSRPSKEYVNYLDEILDARDKQVIYMDEFLRDVGIIEEELREYVEQYGDNVLIDDDYEYDYDDYYMEIENIPNSKFIRQDDNGRYYIALKDILFIEDNLLFTFNNVEYMLDLSNYKETTQMIAVKQYNYVYSYGAELSDNNKELLFIDSKSGKGKTIKVYMDGDNISRVDFEV